MLNKINTFAVSRTEIFRKTSVEIPTVWTDRSMTRIRWPGGTWITFVPMEVSPPVLMVSNEVNTTITKISSTEAPAKNHLGGMLFFCSDFISDHFDHPRYHKPPGETAATTAPIRAASRGGYGKEFWRQQCNGDHLQKSGEETEEDGRTPYLLQIFQVQRQSASKQYDDQGDLSKFRRNQQDLRRKQVQSVRSQNHAGRHHAEKSGDADPV